MAKRKDPTLEHETANDPHRIARLVRARYYDMRDHLHPKDTLRYYRGQWWLWKDGRYIVVETDAVRAEIVRQAKQNFDLVARIYGKKAKRVYPYLVNAVCEVLKSELLVPGDLDQPVWLPDQTTGHRWVACLSGRLDIDALLAGRPGVRQPTPEWFSPTVLPWRWDPEAKAPLWREFLDRVLEHDVQRINLVHEWMGYCTTFDTSLQKFLMTEGEGRNGKSVFLDVLTAFLGPDNVSNVPLEFFGDRFQLTCTIGKLANIATEIGEVRAVAEGLLKAFTGGDRMYFDRKNMPGVQARPTARLVFATNNRARFEDRSKGVWERMILLPFNVYIPEDERDLQLASKIIATELSGIANEAIEGLRRLRQQGHFTQPAISKEALEDYQREANPAKAYLLDNYCESAGRELDCGILYGIYVQHCENNGYRKLDARQFGKEVTRAFPKIERKRLGEREDRRWTYVGLASIGPIPVDGEGVLLAGV